MKKLLVALMIAGASTGAAADTIYGIYAGVGTWQAAYNGDAGGINGNESADLDDLNIDDSENMFVYLALEHPIPVLPNVRLAHAKVQTEGAGTLVTNFEIDGETFSAGTDIYTDLDLTHTDGTLYYELLDNWVSLDLGLTARLFDGYVEVSDVDPDTATARSERVELSDAIPMLYGKVKFDLPMTGWHIAGTANYVSYSGDTFSDLDAKIGYRTDGLLVDFGLDLGYRQMNLDISEDDLQADLSIAGPYLAVTVHF